MRNLVSAGNPFQELVERGWLGGVLAGAVRTTVSWLVGERVMPGVRVADGGYRVPAQRQAHIQSESGPEQPVIAGRAQQVQTAEDRDQHHRQRFERHVMRPDAISVSFPGRPWYWLGRRGAGRGWRPLPRSLTPRRPPYNCAFFRTVWYRFVTSVYFTISRKNAYFHDNNWWHTLIFRLFILYSDSVKSYVSNSVNV